MENYIDTFLTYLRNKGKSEGTIKNYKSDLKIFNEYLKGKNNNKKITKEILNNMRIMDLLSFVNYLQKERQLQLISLSRKISSVKSLFAFLKKIDILEKDISIDLEKPKTPRKNPVYLTEEEGSLLLDTVLKNKEYTHCYRDYCIIALMLNHGLRLSEVLNLKQSDMQKITYEKDGENQTVYLLNIMGKGDKQRIIYLNSITENAIRNYINEENIAVDELFNLSDVMIEKIVSKYVKQSGIKKHITPHKLRHSSATYMLNKTKNLRLVQEMLGHSNISTTQIYTHVSNEELRDACTKFQIG